MTPALNTPRTWLLLSTALMLSLTACSKKADVKSSVSELEQAFPTAAAQSPVPAQPSLPTVTPKADANALVKAALSAARASDYASGVIALQAAQDRPGLTADQVMATQRAQQAMMGDRQRRAASGDQAALAQLKALRERARNRTWALARRALFPWVGDPSAGLAAPTMGRMRGAGRFRKQDRPRNADLAQTPE